MTLRTAILLFGDRECVRTAYAARGELAAIDVWACGGLLPIKMSHDVFVEFRLPWLGLAARVSR